MISIANVGLHWWVSGKESTCQCWRRGFAPWVSKIAWRRKWQPTPVFLPGKSHGQRSPAGNHSWAHIRVGHHSATKWQLWLKIHELVWCFRCARYLSKCFTQINPCNPLNNLWNRYYHHPHFTGKETEAQLRTPCLVTYRAPCHTASACYSQDVNQSGCRIEVPRLPLRSVILASLKSAKRQAVSRIMFHFTFRNTVSQKSLLLEPMRLLSGQMDFTNTAHKRVNAQCLGVCSTPVY